MESHYTLNNLKSKGVQLYKNPDTQIEVYLIQGKVVKVAIEPLRKEADYQRRARKLMGSTVPKVFADYRDGMHFFMVQEYLDDADLIHDIQYYNHPYHPRALPNSVDPLAIKTIFSKARVTAVNLLKNGIFHGDVHTANVLFKQISGEVKIHIIDFGRSSMVNEPFCSYVYHCFKRIAFDKLGITEKDVHDILLNQLTQPHEMENVVLILTHLCNYRLELHHCKQIGCFPNFLAFWFDAPWDKSVHGITCDGESIVDIDINVFKHACRKSFDIKKCIPYAKGRTKTKRKHRSI